MERYILDTNFVSELRKPAVNKGCSEWMKRNPAESTYLTTITLCEIMQGIALREAGVERDVLTAWMKTGLMAQFADRIFVFDQASALIYGQHAARVRRQGKPRPVLDMQIASIALANGCAIVSHNTRDFSGFDVEVINPWT